MGCYSTIFSYSEISVSNIYFFDIQFDIIPIHLGFHIISINNSICVVSRCVDVGRRPNRRTHACGQAQHHGAGQYVTSYRKTAVDSALGISFCEFRNYHVAVFHFTPNNLVNSVHP